MEQTSILMTADHFYNAYQLLEANEQQVEAEIAKGFIDGEPTEEFIAKVNARSFRQTAIPGITCLAFSTELYLKALITFTTGRTKFIEHDTKGLFDAIPDKERDELVAVILEQLPDDAADTVFKRIEFNSKAFVQFRYFHEAPAGRDHMTPFAVLFVLSLRKVLAPRY